MGILATMGGQSRKAPNFFSFLRYSQSCWRYLLAGKAPEISHSRACTIGTIVGFGGYHWSLSPASIVFVLPTVKSLRIFNAEGNVKNVLVYTPITFQSKECGIYTFNMLHMRATRYWKALHFTATKFTLRGLIGVWSTKSKDERGPKLVSVKCACMCIYTRM